MKKAGKKKKESSSRIILRKHSAMIQVSNTITGVQRKAWNVLIQKARQDLQKNPDQRVFEIPITKIQKLSVSSTQRVHLKKMLRDLKKINIEFNILNKDREFWGCYSLLSSLEIEKGKVRFEFPERIRGAILYPRVFAHLDLAVLKGLRSKYAIALYENAKDYIRTNLPVMDIEKLRELLGVREDQYRRNRDFVRWVLKPAIQEVNQKTDLTIRYEREGDRIKLYVESKVDRSTAELIQNAYEKALSHNLLPPQNFRLRRSQILWFFLCGDPTDKVAAYIRATENESIKDPMAFVRSKISFPPDDRFEDLLYAERVPESYADVIFDRYAWQWRLPMDWQRKVSEEFKKWGYEVIDLLTKEEQIRIIYNDDGVYLDCLPEFRMVGKLNPIRVYLPHYIERYVISEIDGAIPVKQDGMPLEEISRTFIEIAGTGKKRKS